MGGSDPAALWHAAHRDMAAGAVEAAERLFGAAAAADHAPAQYDLARMHLYGMAAQPDIEQGLSWLERSGAQGYAPAIYQSAVLAMSGRVLDFEPDRIEGDIRQAALAGHPPALRTLGVLAAASGSSADMALADRCLEWAARRGDVLALALLSQRLLSRCEDHLALGRGAAMRDALHDRDLPLPPADPAIERLNPFAAAESGVSELPKLAAAIWSPPLAAAAEPLNAAPSVRRIPALLDEEECLYLMLAVTEHLQPSVTIDPAGTVRQLRLRTSDEALLDPLLEDVVMLRAQRRMAAAAGLPLAHAEHLILLRYQPGQEYRPHCDYLPPSAIVPLSKGGSGQRATTAIACLAPAARGGATAFPKLGLSVQPGRGDLLVFDNLDAEGRPEPRSLHAGTPVEAGTKWIATLWLRQGPQRSI